VLQRVAVEAHDEALRARREVLEHLELMQPVLEEVGLPLAHPRYETKNLTRADNVAPPPLSWSRRVRLKHHGESTCTQLSSLSNGVVFDRRLRH